MLVAEELMVFYENMLAINNINLRCQPNQIVGVFGANSAGKSTLMYTLSGIILDLMKKEKMRGGERITVMGSITLNGEDISTMKPHLRARRGLVLCPERRRLFPESSVLENLKIGGYMASKQEARETLDYVLEIFSPLKKLLRRPAGFLSGGEQQMAAIGRALMAQPTMLLLDEPLLGLSPAYQQVVMQSVKRIRETRKISIIITEQYARPVIPVVDYAYIMENGSGVMAGTSAELMNNPDVKSAYFGV
ncbi:MAG: ATP-binding cassette domain-containing protein [Deltaproteobacteria bacterium]|nr:ATP-binding cassette domain-containing protein [Candidatus Anaeroferrophillus wilburensis]MBN2888508.1 ATP-binding cassette domain-containing protein [Deltaproteobacteria bacterium]